MRTIVDLTDEQIEQLRRLCAAQGISRAEAVRRGVDLLISERANRLERRRKALEAAVGTWRGGDGLEYERAIRAEWDHRP